MTLQTVCTEPVIICYEFLFYVWILGLQTDDALKNNKKLSKNNNFLLTNGFIGGIIRVVKGVHLVLQTKTESGDLLWDLYRGCMTT